MPRGGMPTRTAARRWTFGNSAQSAPMCATVGYIGGWTCILSNYLRLAQTIIMLPVLMSVITRALVSSENCFGGVETFERMSTTNYESGSVPLVGVLLQQENVALTRDCINLCKQQQRCSSFILDYQQYRCSSYAENSRRHREHLKSSKTSNLFEKMCLKGISRQEFDQLCGNERLWAFERVKDTFIDGFVDKELTNMIDKEECAKACLTESAFICRSADFDEVRRICRLSKENRRTQPQAFVYAKGSQRDYLENQCAPSGPASCIYTTKSNTNVYSMDSLQFATSSEDCQLQCDRESSFNCRSFGFLNNRCMLSADDERTIGKHPLTVLKGSLYGERTCVAELCTNGIFTYEKITGHTLRSAITTPVELPNYSSFGVTGWCRESCDMAQLNCPAFTVSYQNSRCERLDRNTQGRINDLIPKEGESYFEKICLRVPQIMSQCQDKFWAFERVLGYELAPVLYVKTLNFVQSRRDCEEYCLQEREFPCRSALYNDETTECKLSPEDRRTTPGLYYRSRSIKVNYLENQCVRAHSTCPYVRTTDAYPTYTDIVETNSATSSNECEKMCNDNRHFLCRSYGYYSSNGQCFLSGDDSASAGSLFSQKRSSIMYYERQCSKLPPTTFNTTQQPNNNNAPDDYHNTGSTIDAGGVSTYSHDKDTESTRGEEKYPSPPSTSSVASVTKEIIIENGTLGGILTTKVTRFPESLLPTLSPQAIVATSNSYESNTNFGDMSSSVQPPRHNYGMPSESPTQETSNSMGGSNSNQNNLSTNTKCAPNARFLFEKVTSFEPIGGHLSLLYSDLQNPGIVTECARRCEHSAHCRAFVVDYYHQSCYGLFENSSIGSLDLRLSMGKDYFEGFCVPNHVHCDKFWPFDRIIDQMTVGARPEEVLRFISRSECRARCLEERKFRCLSVSYNSFTHECHLYSEDRNSGTLTLQFSKGIDFMENQCAIDVKSCRYHAIERDISIVSVTKSIRGTSTFHCEQACDYEKEFNCRSYTYLDNPDGSVAPGGNLCLLSADNRATSHQGSMQFRPRALYAEKDCAFSRPSSMGLVKSNLGLSNLKPDKESRMREAENILNSTNFHDHPEQIQINPRNMVEDDLDSGKSILSDSAYQSNSSPESQMIKSPEDITQLQHIPSRCEPNEYTFEKTFGYDLRYARRERAPIPSRPAVVSYCRQECIQRGELCRSFVVEYGPKQQQNCFLLDEAASEHRNQLYKLPGASYSEKICLREKTCGKLWTFERIIGYTLDEPAEKEVASIMLRTSCQDLCLAEKNFSCRSITYDYGRRVCRLYKETRRSKPNSFKPTMDHVDYFENQCANDLSTCQYRDYQGRQFSYADRILITSSLTECQRKCDSEESFHCKSVNYDATSSECALSDEDSFGLFVLQSHFSTTTTNSNSLDASIAQYEQESTFSEKGNCEQVSVQCNQQDMVLLLNFDSPFYGRVYTKSNPSQCFATGDGQTKVQFVIPLNSKCGTHQESTSNYANEVIVQQHSVIMTDSDRTIRVLCSFEVSDQTVTLGNAEQKDLPLAPNGIDVSANSHGRSYGEKKMSSTFVANTAAPPTIVMRILNHSGQDAQVVSLGDDLTLRIELKDHKGSAFAMFARNLYARSSSGESLFLIDNNGCPVDSSVFPALRLDPADNRSLYSRFKAFRFPTTGVVNFEVQIRFCQQYCQPIRCAQANEHVHSFGRRRRRRSVGTFHEIIPARNKNQRNGTLFAPLFEHSVSSALLEADNSSSLNTSTNTNGPSSPQAEATFRSLNQTPIDRNTELDSVGTVTNDANRPQTEEDGMKQLNFTVYARTRSNKTGFTYPSSNYRYYRNRDFNLKLDKNKDVSPDFVGNFNEMLPAVHTTNDPMPMREVNSAESNKNSINRAVSVVMNQLHPSDSSLAVELLPKKFTIPNDDNAVGVKPLRFDYSSHLDQEKIDSSYLVGSTFTYDNVDQNNFVDPSEPSSSSGEVAAETTAETETHWNSVANIAPVPAITTEVPLSLAIMVDDDEKVNEHLNSDLRGNEFDDPARQYARVDNMPPPPPPRPLPSNEYRSNYADMAKLQIRKDHHFGNDRHTNHQQEGFSASGCTEECNTGLAIFVTTLTVTIIHLTLVGSVYLYLNKLKRNTQLKSVHPSFMLDPRIISLTPSSSSSMSSFGPTEETLGLGEDNTMESLQQYAHTDSISINELGPIAFESRECKLSKQKPFKLFGVADDLQTQPTISSSSIRSAFNRDNVFFGPKEQRFLGINNYSFNPVSGPNFSK